MNDNRQRPTGLDIGLIHYPVLNKTDEIIGSAVTNLDLHDIARAAKTYGVANYYIVTPYQDQQQLVEEILEHWRQGYGSTYNPARKSALGLISTLPSIERLLEVVTEKQHNRPLIVMTSARISTREVLPYNDCRKMIQSGRPILLLFGTAHGLAEPVIEMADAMLPPIEGTTGYNHLSVRSAVSIILDRLLGDYE